MREADRKSREVGMLQSSVESQLAQTRETVNDLRGTLQGTETKLREAEAGKETHRREAELLGEQLRQIRDDLAEERRRSIERLRGIEDDRMRAEMERQRLQQQLDAQRDAVVEIQNESEAARSNENEAAQLLQDQRLVNKALRERLDEMAEELAEGRDMLGEAEKRVAAAVLNAEREVNSERARADEVEASFTDVLRSSQNQSSRIAELERAVADRRQQQEAMTQHFDTVIEGLRADASAAVARATAAEQRSHNAEAELEALLSSRSTSERVAAQNAKDLRDTRAELEDASADRESANARLRDLQKRYDMSTGLVDQYKRTNERQSRELEDLKRDLEYERTSRGRASIRPRSPAPATYVGSVSGEEVRMRELEAEAKYAELVRASDSLVEEMTREKGVLQERIHQLEARLTGGGNESEALRRQIGELQERNERDVALAQHLRRQLEERDIQLDDKSRQILEASMVNQGGTAQRAADMQLAEQELASLRAANSRLQEQVERQQRLIDAKEQALVRERQVLQETLRVERAQRQALEDEVIRLRPLATAGLSASGGGGMSSSGFPREQELQNQIAQLVAERDGLQQRVQAVKETLVKKQLAYEQEIDSLRLQLRTLGG